MNRLAKAMILTCLLAGCAPPGEGPATTQAVETTRKAYPVYFEAWSSALDEPAREGLRQAAALARAHPQVPLLVVGFTDPAGTPEANIQLSRLRATVVADELKAQGVAAERIRTEWRGATTPAMSSIESRRVEVRIDPG